MSSPFQIFKDPEPENKPWYQKGLKFKCTECGQCCTGAPGYTWVTEKESEAIANFLNISLEEFSKKYLRKVNDRLSLTEKPVTYDCIFLKDKKCQIYPVRPTQCRTFPWWAKNLNSEEDWNHAATFCEGINNDAELVPLEKIQDQLEIQKRSGHLL